MKVTGFKIIKNLHNTVSDYQKPEPLHTVITQQTNTPMRKALWGDLCLLLGGNFLLHLLDDTDRDGLAHVTDGETAKRREVLVRLNAHRIGGDHVDNAGVTVLDELGVVLDLLAGTLVQLGEEFAELARDVRGVAIEHGRVARLDLTGVVKDDNLGLERQGLPGRVVLGVRRDVATADVLHGDVLDVEANVVTGRRHRDGGVVHLHRLDLGGHASGREGHNHAGLELAGLNTADRNSSDAADLVNILERQTKRERVGALGRGDGVEVIEEGDQLLLPVPRVALVPG